MTSIVQLITEIRPYIPFANVPSAQAFLSRYSPYDQAALISALYIGRDHIHYSSIKPDYVPDGMELDRYFHTGDASYWLINPTEFAEILNEKNTSLFSYYDAFLRCVPSSLLANF